MAQVLGANGVSSSISIYKHGAAAGHRPTMRSAVVTVVGPETDHTGPTPEEQPPGPPGPQTTDCDEAQRAMIASRLAEAREWVNDATRKVTDYAYIFASSRHSAVPRDPATAAVVRGALTDNFHTVSTGHVLQIRDGFQELRSAMNTGIDYECEDASCANLFGGEGEDAAYVRGGAAFIRRLGAIHVCPIWFNCRDLLWQIGALIHERAHQHPGAGNDVYEWDPAYASMAPADAIDNAESYAVAARQIFHNGAHGPGTHGSSC